MAASQPEIAPSAVFAFRFAQEGEAYGQMLLREVIGDNSGLLIARFQNFGDGYRQPV
jgi:hypothetical protein